jgi:hypothetical protein
MTDMNDITPIGVVILENSDITQAVREAAMLAYVSIGAWSATEKDDALIEEVKSRHGATGEVGTVIKYLLSGADSKLKEVRAAFHAVRNHHYKLTLPWVNDPHAPTNKGPRLLPHLIYPRYMVEISEKRRAALAALEEFLVVYPDLVIQAKANLSSMVGQSSYPTPEQLRKLFRLHVDFSPIPAGQHFTGLNEHMRERLTENLRKKQERQIMEASSMMWARARERIERLADRMEISEGAEANAEHRELRKRFKEATIENVRDLLTLLPGWNIAGNPMVDEITQDIEQMLHGLDAGQLRRDDELRKEVGDEAKKIVDKMARWGL